MPVLTAMSKEYSGVTGISKISSTWTKRNYAPGWGEEILSLYVPGVIYSIPMYRMNGFCRLSKGRPPVGITPIYGTQKILSGLLIFYSRRDPFFV
jgi:hypothetical protein